jgi:alkylation response protein AidB-like acyl-CoA dehydrogenase
MTTTATKTPEGDYLLRGEKLWTTNGTFAELVVVITRDPETKKMSCLVMETSAPGVKIAHGCRFMGLRAIEN